MKELVADFIHEAGECVLLEVVAEKIKENMGASYVPLMVGVLSRYTDLEDPVSTKDTIATVVRLSKKELETYANTRDRQNCDPLLDLVCGAQLKDIRNKLEQAVAELNAFIEE
jgi:hypothetical protein